MPPDARANVPWEMERAHRMLSAMRSASENFYRAAVRSECHAFVEFTGLMNEYIKVCERMTAEGHLDWMGANTHSGTPMDIRDYELRYLAEKLDCIYGPSMRRSEEMRKAIFE